MTKKQIARDMFFIAVVSMVFLSIFSWSYPFLVPDEARYIEVAREMLASGNYITPHLNGSIYLDKPILFFWCESMIIHVFGVHEWSARLLPEFFATLGSVFCYWAGVKLYNRRTGLLSAGILTTMGLYFFLAHYTDMDMLIAVLTSCSLWLFIVAVNEQTDRLRSCYFLLMYVFAGFAFLAKGLIGFVFPIAIIGLWIMLMNQWRILKNVHLVVGLIIIAVITLPWLIMVQQQPPSFLHYFFYVEQCHRYVATNFHQQHSIFFFVPILLVGVLPWTVFLYQAMAYFIKQIRNDIKSSGNEIYLLLWPLFILVFFSLPHTKLVGYILEVFPPIAMIIACYLDRHWHKKLVLCLLVGTVIFELAFMSTMRLYPLRSVKPLVLMIQQHIKPQDKVVSFDNCYFDAMLYLARPITIVSDWHVGPNVKDNWQHDLSQSIIYQHYQSPYFIDQAQFNVLWHSPQRLFVLVDVGDESAGLRRLVKSPVYQLGQAGKVELVSNRL